MLVAGAAVELEAEYVGRDLGGALTVIPRRDRAIRHVRTLRRAGKISSAPGQTMDGPPIGRNSDRRRVAFAEQRDIDGGEAVVTP